jgi:hypothetical protein
MRKPGVDRLALAELNRRCACGGTRIHSEARRLDAGRAQAPFAVRVTGWSRVAIHPVVSRSLGHSVGSAKPGAHARTDGDHRGESTSKSGLRFSTNEATPSFTSLPQNPRNSSAKDASKIGPA